MIWTTEKPTQPGWYWCRWFDEYEYGEPFTCYLDHNDDDILCVIQLEFAWLPLDEFGVRQWAGPIPHPEEP